MAILACGRHRAYWPEPRQPTLLFRR